MKVFARLRNSVDFLYQLGKLHGLRWVIHPLLLGKSLLDQTGGSLKFFAAA